INGQTQIDDAGIQRVDALRQIQSERIAAVKPTCLANEVLSQIGKDTPVAAGQRVGQRAAFDELAQPQMIELFGSGVQTRFDVAKTFAPSQLGENQTDKLLPGSEVFDLVIAAITNDTATELLSVNKIEQLRENKLAAIHDSRITANRLFADRRNS